MLQLIAGFRISRIVYAAARLGLADLLQPRPADSATLAALTGTDPPSLHRLLRALASIGVLAEDEEGRFSLTTLGKTLRSDVPESLRAWAIFSLGDEHFRAWGELLHSVRTGEVAFDHLFGTDVWTYRAAHTEHAAIFDQAMAQLVKAYDASLVASYPFAAFDKLVDVGGGDGTLLIAILRANPGMRGVLFDLPHVAERARNGSTRRDFLNAARSFPVMRSLPCHPAETPICFRASFTIGMTSTRSRCWKPVARR